MKMYVIERNLEYDGDILIELMYSGDNDNINQQLIQNAIQTGRKTYKKLIEEWREIEKNLYPVFYNSTKENVARYAKWSNQNPPPEEDQCILDALIAIGLTPMPYETIQI